MPRRSFSSDYKIETVRQIRDRGISASQAAREVGIRQNVLSRWIKEFHDAAAEKPVGAKNGRGKRGRAVSGKAGGHANGVARSAPAVAGSELSELQRLRRELHRITSERDTLKKAIVFLARDTPQPAA
jgi:transposase